MVTSLWMYRLVLFCVVVRSLGGVVIAESQPSSVVALSNVCCVKGQSHWYEIDFKSIIVALLCSSREHLHDDDARL